MERKHQVFVSSTYKDLIEERQHVIHALLELDCIPAGMELFPAANEDAWTLIKEVIESSDYYLLIIAGKYGSQNHQGVSYTEMEFDYAVSISKPIVCFIYQDIDQLTGNKIEKTEDLQNKLKSFRAKAEQKHCKYWKTSEDLGGKVSRSLIQLKKKHPSDGWIPGKYAADEKLFRTIEELRTKVQELELENRLGVNPPDDLSDYARGSEIFSQPVKYYDEFKVKKEVLLEASWDKLFSYAGSAMVGECTETEFKEKIKLAYYHSVPKKLQKQINYDDVIIYLVVFDQIKVQFQALGLVTHGSKKRTVSDKEIYWKLTAYGERYLIKVRAIKKNNSDDLV
jgi:hypothetical protein